MKKFLCGFQFLLVIILAIYLYSLWGTLHTDPLEGIQLQDYELHGPPVFQLSLLEDYPHLFDVEKPKDDPQKNGVPDISGDELATREGRLRVRAIFIRDDQRLALVEQHSAGLSTLVEARVNDALQGYRVLAVEPRHIRLEQMEHGALVDLVIFERN